MLATPGRRPTRRWHTPAVRRCECRLPIHVPMIKHRALGCSSAIASAHAILDALLLLRRCCCVFCTQLQGVIALHAGLLTYHEAIEGSGPFASAHTILDTLLLLLRRCPLLAGPAGLPYGRRYDNVAEFEMARRTFREQCIGILTQQASITCCNQLSGLFWVVLRQRTASWLTRARIHSPLFLAFSHQRSCCIDDASGVLTCLQAPSHMPPALPTPFSPLFTTF